MAIEVEITTTINSIEIDSNEYDITVGDTITVGTGSGEVNTAANIGTAGVGVYKTKSGVQLQFKKINAGSSKVTITDDVVNSEVDIDVAEANISYNNIADTPTIPSALSDLTGDLDDISNGLTYVKSENNFTDTLKTKLDGIESAATADQTGAEIKAAYEAEANTNAYTDAEKSKLAAIEANATADQTGAEIKSLYEAELDTNAYTDAEKSKLAGVEVGAEVNNISDLNATDLTDAGDSSLHFHSTDRARANHTGTQAAATISDFDTEVSNNTDVSANTSARHARGHSITSTSDHTAGNWKVVYTNGLGQVVELALGAANTYLKSNGVSSIPSFDTPGGSGDVVGPASSTDNAIARFDSTTGKLLQNSLATLSDAGTINIPTGQSYQINGVAIDTDDVSEGTNKYVSDTASTAAPSGTNDGFYIKENGTKKYKTFDNASKSSRTIILTAGGGHPSTTNGCADPTKTEFATNDVDLVTLDFDQTTGENAQWTIVMPDSYDGGTITAIFVWTAASGSGGVTWGLQGIAYADSGAIDAAWGTAQEVNDTLLTADDVHITSATSAITLAGSPAGGQLVQFRAYRDPADASDTLAADAKLISVKIEYGINKWSD